MALRVLVIGGGIGGLCLAQGLQRAGVDVTVYERDRSASARRDRYRLHINPAGSRSLRACLTDAAWQRYLAGAGRPGGGFGFLNTQLRTHVVVDDDIMYPPTDDPAENAYPVDRSMLRAALLTGLDEVVVFGKQFACFEQHPDGRVSAQFVDGDSDEADVLVGADGVNSAVARQYLPRADRIEAGAFGVGLRLPLTDETRRWLPVRVGIGENQIMDGRPFFLFTSVYERPVGAEPGPHDYVLCAFVTRADACPRGMADLDGAELQQAVGAMITDWHPCLRRMIVECDRASVSTFPFTTSAALEAWEPGPVTLLGDAVHAMPPTGGLGANTALRDARLLSRQLAAAAAGEISLCGAVGTYEAEMRRYGSTATTMSLKTLRDGLGRNRFGPTWFGLCNRVPALKRMTFGETWAAPARAQKWECANQLGGP